MASKKRLSGAFCSAINCRNARQKDECRGMSFFKLPARDEPRCRKWIQNMRRQDLVGKTMEKVARNGYLLCSKHFEPSQFNVPAERKRLVFNAVPTLFDFPNPPATVSMKRPLKLKERSSCVAPPLSKRPCLADTTIVLADMIKGSDMTSTNNVTTNTTSSTNSVDCSLRPVTLEPNLLSSTPPQCSVVLEDITLKSGTIVTSGTWQTPSECDKNRVTNQHESSIDLCQLPDFREENTSSLEFVGKEKKMPNPSAPNVDNKDVNSISENRKRKYRRRSDGNKKILRNTFINFNERQLRNQRKKDDISEVTKGLQKTTKTVASTKSLSHSVVKSCKNRIGRPKKVETIPKNSVGRPRETIQKNPVGRPRKTIPKNSVGRPKNSLGKVLKRALETGGSSGPSKRACRSTTKAKGKCAKTLTFAGKSTTKTKTNVNKDVKMHCKATKFSRKAREFFASKERNKHLMNKRGRKSKHDKTGKKVSQTLRKSKETRKRLSHNKKGADFDEKKSNKELVLKDKSAKNKKQKQSSKRKLFFLVGPRESDSNSDLTTDTADEVDDDLKFHPDPKAGDPVVVVDRDSETEDVRPFNPHVGRLRAVSDDAGSCSDGDIENNKTVVNEYRRPKRMRKNIYKSKSKNAPVPFSKCSVKKSDLPENFSFVDGVEEETINSHVPRPRKLPMFPPCPSEEPVSVFRFMRKKVQISCCNLLHSCCKLYSVGTADKSIQCDLGKEIITIVEPVYMEKRGMKRKIDSVLGIAPISRSQNLCRPLSSSNKIHSSFTEDQQSLTDDQLIVIDEDSPHVEDQFSCTERRSLLPKNHSTLTRIHPSFSSSTLHNDVQVPTISLPITRKQWSSDNHEPKTTIHVQMNPDFPEASGFTVVSKPAQQDSTTLSSPHQNCQNALHYNEVIHKPLFHSALNGPPCEDASSSNDKIENMVKVRTYPVVSVSDSPPKATCHSVTVTNQSSIETPHTYSHQSTITPRSVRKSSDYTKCSLTSNSLYWTPVRADDQPTNAVVIAGNQKYTVSSAGVESNISDQSFNIPHFLNISPSKTDIVDKPTSDKKKRTARLLNNDINDTSNTSTSSSPTHSCLVTTPLNDKPMIKIINTSSSSKRKETFTQIEAPQTSSSPHIANQTIPENDKFFYLPLSTSLDPSSLNFSQLVSDLNLIQSFIPLHSIRTILPSNKNMNTRKDNSVLVGSDEPPNGTTHMCVDGLDNNTFCGNLLNSVSVQRERTGNPGNHSNSVPIQLDVKKALAKQVRASIDAKKAKASRVNVNTSTSSLDHVPTATMSHPTAIQICSPKTAKSFRDSSVDNRPYK